jgi:hypothetical protein
MILYDGEDEDVVVCSPSDDEKKNHSREKTKKTIHERPGNLHLPSSS